MKRLSLLPYEFLFIFLYNLILLTERNGLLAIDCPSPPPDSSIKLSLVVGYYNITNSPNETNIQNYVNDATRLTHLIIVYASDNDLSILMNVTKPKSSKCKILLSVQPTTLLAGTQSLQNISSYYENLVNEYTLDGLDLEYPCPSSSSDIISSFSTLINTLRHSSTVSSKIISITFRPESVVTRGQDFTFANLTNSVDFVSIMAYQYDLFNSYTGIVLNSPFESPQPTYRQVLTYFNVFGTSKIVLGVNFGGIIELLQTQNGDFVNGYNTSSTFTRLSYNDFLPTGIGPLDVRCLSSSSYNAYSWSLKEMVAANALSKNLSDSDHGWYFQFDCISQEPYIYQPYNNSNLSNNNNNTKSKIGLGAADGNPPYEFVFVSFENPLSLSMKMAFLNNNNYSGIAIANLEGDTDDQVMFRKLGSVLSSDQSSTPAPSNSPSGLPLTSSSNRLNGGVIAGIVIAAVLFLSILFISIVIFIKRQKGQKNEMSVKRTEIRPDLQAPPNTVVATTTEQTAKTNFVTALYDFEGKEESDLSFKKGDRIEVIERGNGPIDWWVGKVNGIIGEFPGNYVRQDS